MIFFFKQKTAYEMRIGDWSSDVCSSELNDVISAPVPQTPPSAAPPAYPFILFLTENVGAFEAYGLEASLDGQFEQGWKWALNYTWTKIGRAAWRERACQYGLNSVVAVTLTKKTK